MKDAESGLTYERALDVYKVSTEKRRGSSTDTVTCFRCGITDNLAPQCKIKEVTCNQCR